MQVAHPLRDGIWDEEEDSTSPMQTFGWQSRVTSSTSVDTASTRTKSSRASTSKKDEAKSLKGKGRRGELRLATDAYAYHGPVLSTIVSPNENIDTPSTGNAPLKSPAFHRPLPPPCSPSFYSPATLSTASSACKQSWAQRAGQSIKRFGRSKSSGNLRTTAGFSTSDLPPLPVRPAAVGMSHSTPPLGESSKINTQKQGPELSRGRSHKRFSPPPPLATVALSRHDSPAHLFEIPHDPFASPLYPVSTLSQSPLEPPGSFRSRSKGPRSPSLRDMRMPSMPSLRDLRPSLVKTKSWASFPRGSSGPTSAPLEQTSFFPLVSSSLSPSSLPTHNHHLANAVPFPTESPPLLPPNPPYFPVASSPLQSPFLPSTPPPTSPLPLTPSKSTPVLLPRSRSTSVSLKAPPTSSSFFDLYEQLGIWPSVEDQAKEHEKVKVAEAEAEADSPPTAHAVSEPIAIRQGDKPSRSLPSLPSSSSDILSASWERAISSFPFVAAPDHGGVSLDDEEDLGNMADTSLSTVDWLQTPADAGDEHEHGHGRQRASGQSAKSSGLPWSGAYRARGDRGIGRRERSGSSSSCDSGSPHRTGIEGSHSEEEEETETEDDSDDVPLGQRIPGAVDVQRELRASEKAKRQKKKKLVSRRVPRAVPVPEGQEVIADLATSRAGEGGVGADALRRKLEALEPVAGPSILSPKLQEEVYRQASVRRSNDGLRAQRSFTNPKASPVIGADLTRRHTDRRFGPTVSGIKAPPLPTASASSSMKRRDKAPVGLGLGDCDKSESPRIGAQDHSESSRQRAHSGSLYSVPSSRKPSLIPIRTASRAESPLPSPRLRSNQKSPLPLLPSEDLHHSRTGSSAHARAPLAIVKSEAALQQRAFVGSLQGKALHLEIEPGTRARDVIDWAFNLGELASGGDEWVIYEVFAELGCERPLREFELLADVMHGWNQEARVNTFLFRQSRAAGKTLARAVPRVPPYVGAYVQYESKKGKWSKRWLEAREGSIFLAKNDRQKDETFVCLAAAYDVYAMTRPYKAPKSFTFVLKSRDSAVLFEDPADYLHVFSSEDSTAHKLIDAIYQTRSTSLILDKPQLLHAIPATRASAPSPVPSSLPVLPYQSGTVRNGFLGRRKTTKPLVEVSDHTPKISSPFTGGLLGRRV